MPPVMRCPDRLKTPESTAALGRWDVRRVLVNTTITKPDSLRDGVLRSPCLRRLGTNGMSSMRSNQLS